MGTTTVNLDDLIEQAGRVLGTSSIGETIEAALREVLRGDARQQKNQGTCGNGRTGSRQPGGYGENVAFMSSSRDT